jgi:hypothetical protein
MQIIHNKQFIMELAQAREEKECSHPAPGGKADRLGTTTATSQHLGNEVLRWSVESVPDHLSTATPLGLPY